MPPRVVAFDVNETLLDMTGLDPHFEAAFGSAAVRARDGRQPARRATGHRRRRPRRGHERG